MGKQISGDWGGSFEVESKYAIVESIEEATQIEV